jgi:2,4-dienoyl-CoA reductase-like NADH-dependent reductase (Old Yellow Enzyme family)/NADPH-dependent 2,4-dienoyl-CoA reductase/sulfur reductase-like enzyme
MMSAPTSFPAITSEGHYMPATTAFYELKAKGGVASVCCTEGIVHPSGLSHSRMVNMQDEFVVASLTDTARAVKKYGAAAVMEISHGGKYSDVDNVNKTDLQKRNIRYGPSAAVLPGGAIAEEMSKAIIAEIVDAFGSAAAVCKKAGFDMILLHAGHGWLIHQFLQAIDNKRTDEYGGSLANRTRFLREVIESIRGKIGRDFPLEVRISAEDYREGANPFSDVIEIAKSIEDSIDLIQVSTGSHEESFDRTHPSMFYPRGCNVHYAEAVKRNVKIPVATLGGLNDPAMMEDIIASGKADVVELGRALLADPELPQKVLEGREDEIMPCIRCFTCLAERIHTKTRICSVNPLIGREQENLSAFPPTIPKKVVVAGGGPAGMKAAATAAERGHDVTLYEQNPELGGAVRCERAIPFKKDYFNIIGVLERRMQKAGVEVKKGVAFTPEIAEAEMPDAVIVAVGAKPLIPPLDGMDSSKVLIANRLSDDEAAVGATVVVLGGGLVGSEAAVHLAQRGHQVTIVEMLDDITADANVIHARLLRAKITELGITVLTKTKGVSVTDTGLEVADREGGREVLPADTILVAAGQRPDFEAADALANSAPVVKYIGDCVKPKNVSEALTRGYYAALSI